jgi:hypothetical protein
MFYNYSLFNLSHEKFNKRRDKWILDFLYKINYKAYLKNIYTRKLQNQTTIIKYQSYKKLIYIGLNYKKDIKIK